MRMPGIRFRSVTGEAEALARFLDSGLGLQERDMPTASDDFTGAVSPAGDSWIESWPEGPQTPAGIMPQIVADDADARAAQVRPNGLAPEGPMGACGERIYVLTAPSGLSVSFQPGFGS